VFGVHRSVAFHKIAAARAEAAALVAAQRQRALAMEADLSGLRPLSPTLTSPVDGTEAKSSAGGGGQFGFGAAGAAGGGGGAVVTTRDGNNGDEPTGFGGRGSGGSGGDGRKTFGPTESSEHRNAWARRVGQCWDRGAGDLYRTVCKDQASLHVSWWRGSVPGAQLCRTVCERLTSRAACGYSTTTAHTHELPVK
jgi:hypothetical protein